LGRKGGSGTRERKKSAELIAGGKKNFANDLLEIRGLLTERRNEGNVACDVGDYDDIEKVRGKSRQGGKEEVKEKKTTNLLQEPTENAGRHRNEGKKGRVHVHRRTPSSFVRETRREDRRTKNGDPYVLVGKKKKRCPQDPGTKTRKKKASRFG